MKAKLNDINIEDLQTLSLDTLMAIAERIAATYGHGRLALFRYENGWTMMPSVPDMTISTQDIKAGHNTCNGYKQISCLIRYPTLRSLLMAFIAEPWGVDFVDGKWSTRCLFDIESVDSLVR